MEELIGIIKHELCHYHLHLEGKGYQHRDRILSNCYKSRCTKILFSRFRLIKKQKAKKDSFLHMLQVVILYLIEKEELIQTDMYVESAMESFS